MARRISLVSASGRSRLLAGIIAVIACPMGIAAAQPASLTSENLFALYLAQYPELRTDPAFARDWIAVTKCAAWSPISNDEFRAAPFLKAGAAELAAGRGDPPATYVIRLERLLERYDAAAGEFGLRTVVGTDVLPVRALGFFGEGPQGDGFKRGCAPISGRFPVEFDVRFDNPGSANGLPMAPDAAAAFATARTNQYGSRNNAVVVELRVTLTLGMPRILGVTTPVKGVIVPVTAHIVDVVVEDGTPQRRPLYRLTEAKRRIGDAEGALAAAQARDEAAIKPVDAAALRAQFEMERARAQVGTEPLRLRVNTAWQRTAQSGNREYGFPMRPSDAYEFGGLSLRFDNADEVTALKPAPELLGILERGGARDATIVYVPVGAYDDPLKGGRGVIGHIVSVDAVDLSTGTRRVFVTRTASQPKVWEGARRDERLAGDFDVAGFKVGMTPDEVIRVAMSELSQKLAFNEARAEVRSAESDCDFEFRRNRAPPPLGRRCLAATFTKAPGTARWVMVKLRLDQTVASEQASKTNEAVIAKYGRADLAGGFEGKLSLSDLEGTEAPRLMAVEWGARLTDQRPERDGVPYPLHPLELTTKTIGMITVMTFKLIDWAALNAQAEATAAAGKRAADTVAPKF